MESRAVLCLAASASRFYSALPAKLSGLFGATCVTLQRKSFKRRSVLSLVPTRPGHSSSILPAINPAINLQGRKRLLAASPLNKDTLLPANPAVLPHQRKYGFIPTESICREGNVCLLRPHSTRTRSSLQTHDRTGRICAATRYGAVFSRRAHDTHEFALTASARRSMPRRSSRRSSSFSGVIRPIDSNNHTVATKAKASRAKTPW